MGSRYVPRGVASALTDPIPAADPWPAADFLAHDVMRRLDGAVMPCSRSSQTGPPQAFFRPERGAGHLLTHPAALALDAQEHLYLGSDTTGNMFKISLGS